MYVCVCVCACVCVCVCVVQTSCEHKLLQVTMIECGGGTSSRPFFAPPLLLLLLIHRIPPAVQFLHLRQRTCWEEWSTTTTWDVRMLKHSTHFDIHCFLVSPPSSSYSAASLSHLRRLLASVILILLPAMRLLQFDAEDSCS